MTLKLNNPRGLANHLEVIKEFPGQLVIPTPFSDHLVIFFRWSEVETVSLIIGHNSLIGEAWFLRPFRVRELYLNLVVTVPSDTKANEALLSLNRFSLFIG